MVDFLNEGIKHDDIATFKLPHFFVLLRVVIGDVAEWLFFPGLFHEADQLHPRQQTRQDLREVRARYGLLVCICDEYLCLPVLNLAVWKLKVPLHLDIVHFLDGVGQDGVERLPLDVDISDAHQAEHIAANIAELELAFFFDCAEDGHIAILLESELIGHLVFLGLDFFILDEMLLN